MIEVTRQGDVVDVKLVHGKANALDIELCEAIVTRFSALRTTPDKAIVLTGQGRMFSAGVDLPRLIEGGADYVCKFLPALHKLYDTVCVSPPKTRDRCGQWTRHRRRLCARLLRRQAHRGSRRRPHRCHGTLGRRAVSGDGV